MPPNSKELLSIFTALNRYISKTKTGINLTSSYYNRQIIIEQIKVKLQEETLQEINEIGCEEYMCKLLFKDS